MQNARLRGYRVNIPHYEEKVDMYVCQNFLKTQYFIVIPVINWGFKMNIEMPYEEIKDEMVKSLMIQNYLPSSLEKLVMDILKIIFND